MLKVGSKRRRPPAEIKAEREVKEQQDAGYQAKFAELKAFEAHIERKKIELQNQLNAEGILNDLIKNGEVKQYEDGSWGADRNVEQ